MLTSTIYHVTESLQVNFLGGPLAPIDCWGQASTMGDGIIWTTSSQLDVKLRAAALLRSLKIF